LSFVPSLRFYFCRAVLPPLIPRPCLSNLLQMLRSGIPRSFGFAIGLAVLTVRDDVRIINNGGFLFLTREQLVTQTVHFTPA
jgi:hypothetical protein